MSGSNKAARLLVLGWPALQATAVCAMTWLGGGVQLQGRHLEVDITRGTGWAERHTLRHANPCVRLAKLPCVRALLHCITRSLLLLLHLSGALSTVNERALIMNWISSGGLSTQDDQSLLFLQLQQASR